jgi:hypothetical protein
MKASLFGAPSPVTLSHPGVTVREVCPSTPQSCTQCLMPRQRSPAAFDREMQPLIQAGGQSRHAQQIHMCRSQLDRQRVPVEPATELHDDGDLGIVELECVRARLGALDKQGPLGWPRGRGLGRPSEPYEFPPLST